MPNGAEHEVLGQRARRAAGLAAATGLLGVVLSMMPRALEIEETLGLGWLFAVRGAARPPDEVLVVNLSGESAEAFGLSSHVDQWPRTLHAHLIERLSSAGAALIAFDIIFDLPRTADGDARLAEAVRRAGNVLLLERVQSEQIGMPAGDGIAVVERRSRPIAPLRDAALATARFTLPVVPIRVGQFWTFGRAEDDVPTLPAAALHAFALPHHDELIGMMVEARPALASRLASLDSSAVAKDGLGEVMRRIRELFEADRALRSDLERKLRGGGRRGRDALLVALLELYDGPASRYLSYYGPARTIRTIPYHRVLRPSAEDPPLEDVVKGRAVFVGFSETRQPEQQDAFFSVFSERSGHNLSGVEIGATAFANLLHGETVRPLPLPRHWLLVALWGTALGALCMRLRGAAAALAAIAAGGGYAAACHYLFQSFGLWTPLAVPLGAQLPFAMVSGLAWNYRVLRQQRERIQAALGYYLPAPVVNRLAHETARVGRARELVFGTCLVTDAEQYTTVSEGLSPTELGELMDAYYDVLVGAVHRQGGVVSDIGGDSMVAVWPAARSAGETRAKAAVAALDALEAIETFNRARVRRELPTRIGLDSGQLLLGDVGGTARGEYRAVGDIVNTAARLQGLNRLLGTRILLSAAAAAETRDLVLRPLGCFLLVGKTVPVPVLELQGRAADLHDGVSALNVAFDAAMRLLRRGRWAEAERAFRALQRSFPQDGPTRFFAAQCSVLAARHSEGEWDGTLRIFTK